MSELVIIFLLAVFVIRELIFQVTIHRLINKLMAKSLTEYTQSMDRLSLEELNLQRHKIDMNAFDQEIEQETAIINSVR